MIRDTMLYMLEELADEEMREANKIHKAFTSPHEGYAVIKEELEEVEDEFNEMERGLESMWEAIKRDMEREAGDSEAMYLTAVTCAAECLQVAAMCRKLKEAYENNYMQE